MTRRLTRREKRRLRRRMKITVFISSVILILGSIYLVHEMYSYQRTQALAADTRVLYYSTEAPVEADIIVDYPKIDRAFDDLFERNNDVVGWISVMDNINYPFVQRDNAYYLTHDYDKNENHSGWIFLDERNSSTLVDDNILIYGHNMKSGSMFGRLDDYKHSHYIETYPTIKIHSIYESQPRYYVIFSVFEASMNSSSAYFFDVDRISFANEEEKSEYISHARQLSIWDIPIDIDSSDQLLTLITCSYYHDNGRLIVLGRALRENEDIDCINPANSILEVDE